MSTTAPFPPETSSSVPVTPLSSSDLYPPSFKAVTRTLVLELLTTDHPEIIIDTAAASLLCRQATLPSDTLPSETQTPPTAYPLIDSVVEYFTGRLKWADVQVLGLYTSAQPAPAEITQPLLDRAAVMSLYDRARQRLHVRFTQAMNDYWNERTASGKSRQQVFVQQRSDTLKLNAKQRVEEGDMDAYAYYRLDAMLKLRDDPAPSPIQPHGIFSVSLKASGKSAMDLTGAFVLTCVYTRQAPADDNQTLGHALLYTTDNGLETFPDLKRLTESLQERLQTPHQRVSLLAALDVQALAQWEKESDGTPELLQCEYLPLPVDFINALLNRQLDKQSSDFAQALQQARSLKMECATFEKRIAKQLSPLLHFDDHQHLDHHDQALVEEKLPGWLRAMTVNQRRQWLRYARESAELAIELHARSVAHFGGDEFNPDTFVDRYVDSLLKKALTEQSVRLAPEHINVSVAHTTPQASGLIPPLYGPITEVTRYTLKTLMHQRQDALNLSGATAIHATDAAGMPVAGISEAFVRSLVQQLETPQAFERFLDLQLNTSPYARHLRETQAQLMIAQLRMALLEAEQQAFPAYAHQWVTAVVDEPDPTHRKTVGVDTIEVRFLQILQTRLPNMLLVVPAGKLNTRPVVLCTFGAPDGIVLRSFDSLSRMKTEFLEREQFKPYIAQQIRASQRPDSLGVLAYDKWLKHWRLPDAMRYMTQPLPIPSVVFHPVNFALQTKNFLDENHDIKIDHLTSEAKLRLAQQTRTGGSLSFDIVTNIALLFLPPPVMLPLALGLAFYKAWSGFREFQADDLQGATQEFLAAIGYVAVGALAAHVKSEVSPLTDEPMPLVATRIRRPHLVRTVGRDGQMQIGYLLSPSSAPRFSRGLVSVRDDAARLVAITLDDETCYVSRRFNLFGHSRLYRLAPGGNGSVMHADEYVLRDSQGIWTLAGGQAPRLSRSAITAAKSTLDDLINDWPSSMEATNEEEKTVFTTRYMTLNSTSNSDVLPEILAYSEGESASINQLLRAGVRNIQTREFLEQFYQLSEYLGPAYRAAFVSDAGLARYQQKIGAVFSDSGVQSASICRANASSWGRNAFVTQNAAGDNHPIVMIFDPSVPKKNMFTSFLGDHVAVAPNTCVQLRAMRHAGERWYAYFSAPKEVAHEVYDIYSGAKELMV